MPSLPDRRRAALSLAATLAAIGAVSSGAYALDVAAAACLTALYVVSWVVFCGPSKEVGFGHALFIGAAGYGSALAQTRWGWSPWAALVLGPVIGALVGALVGVATFRHRGLYFSMITMALQVTFYRALFLQSPLLGGEEGIVGVGAVATTRMGVLLLCAGALLLVLAAASAFLRSRAGLALAATGQNEELARSLGVDVPRARLLGLAASGALAGLGGALYVSTHGQANAELAGEALSIRIVLLGLLGGMWSVRGAVTAAVTMEFVDLLLARAVVHQSLASTAVLLALVVAVRGGLLAERPRWRLAAGGGHAHPPRADARDGGLRVSDASVRHGGLVALDGVSFDLAPGTAIGLIGPNGAGKSTLLDVICGRRRPSRGQVRWGRRLLSGRALAANARHGVVRVFQHATCFPELTVDEHLLVARADVSAPAVARLVAACGAQARSEPLGVLAPASVRLVQIAMALGARPRLVLLDEPFAALSHDQADALAKALDEALGAATSAVMVEHRLGALFARVGRVLVLNRGRLIADDTPARVLAHADVREAYGVSGSDTLAPTAEAR
jgi:branched-chain amino acid transport system permease protein